MPLDQDAIQIVIGGVSYQDWLEVDIDSDIFMPADAWSLTSSMPSADMLVNFREGTKCDVYVGGDRQLSGFIDDCVASGTRTEERLRLSGRDKGGYLLDSEADALKVSRLTVNQLIDKLLKPSFGIKQIISSNDANRKNLIGKADKKGVRAAQKAIAEGNTPRQSMKIDPGQKIATILDEQTQKLGLAWWMTAAGDLFVGKPNYSQETAYSFCSYPPGDRNASLNNIEQWSMARSLTGRYSEIQVNGMGLPSKKDAYDTAQTAPKFKGTATDQDLKDRGIDRKMIVRDCDALSQKEVQHRADMEMGRARLAAQTISITVSGFRDPDSSRLYTIDTLASVKIPAAGVDGVYYLTQRRFREDRGKRRTEIKLVPKGVWLP